MLLYSRRVLQLAEFCRKLETETEQIQPFAPPESDVPGEETGPPLVQKPMLSSVADKSVSESSVRGGGPGPITQASVWTPAGVFVPPMERLWHFQRKYNRMVLEDVSLQREIERLGGENAQLEDLIAQYIEGTTVSDAVLQSENPLFVVNGR